MTNHKVKCANFEIANDKPFTLIAGPCQLESETHALKISSELKKITDELGINLIYKTSFDKANRTSLKGKRGIGLDKSLPIFDKIKTEKSLVIVTDGPNITCGVSCEGVAKVRPEIISRSVSRLGAGDAFFAHFLAYRELNPAASLKKSLSAANRKTKQHLQAND